VSSGFFEWELRDMEGWKAGDWAGVSHE
jgi:hypothetical protein